MGSGPSGFFSPPWVMLWVVFSQPDVRSEEMIATKNEFKKVALGLPPMTVSSVEIRPEG
jgi:hypothetical protein